MRLCIILYCFTSCVSNGLLYAQDLSGTWEGNFVETGPISQPSKVVLELFQIRDKTYTGASHLYYPKGKYEHYKVNASFDSVNKTLTVSEDSVLGYKIPFATSRSAGTYTLRIHPASDHNRADGQWKTKRRFLFRYWSVGAWFRKNAEMHHANVDTSKPAEAVVGTNDYLKRRPDIQSLLEVDPKTTDSIRIDIFDNATIDGDSISLFVDDQLALSHQHLSTKPIQLALPVNKLKSISKLQLVAETVGSIPPCTALMIVLVGKKRYEINLAGDLQTNAVLEIVLRE